MKTLLVALLALAATPAALADGPPEYASQYGPGVAHGRVHYVAVPAAQGQTLVARLRGGSIEGSEVVAGDWGIPRIAYTTAAGLSRDGKRLFLQTPYVPATTGFLVLSTRTLRELDRFTLDGTFTFDALSPDASRLFLIQRVDANDYNRYVVRAYDLRTHRLLRGRIADRTQRDWVMQGSSVARAESPDGRWVYTLYSNPGGFPFVHALDTVRGVAHCVGLPWPETRSQDSLYSTGLRVRDGALDVRRSKGGTLYRIDTRTWAVSTPSHGGASRWWALLALVLLPLAAVERIRRRRRSTRVSVQGGIDVPTARLGARRSPRPRPRSVGPRRRPVVRRGAGW